MKYAEIVKSLVDNSAKLASNSDKAIKILEKNISRIDKIKNFMPENNKILEKINWEEKLNKVITIFINYFYVF